MDNDSIAGPLATLLGLGEPKYARDFTWPDYQKYGIGAEHIPALIQISTDHDLIHLPDEKDARGWGPIHAWRALGQLHAVEAIEPLIRLFHEVPDNDWIIEEMPDVFALIGTEAFPALALYLTDGTRPIYSRLIAATSITQIAISFPEIRGQAVDALVEQLINYKQNSPGMNGVLIANLVELEASEKADLIQKVFSESKVDRFIVGDWRDVKLRLRRPAGQAPIAGSKSLERNIGSTPPDPNAKPGYQEPRTTPRSRPDAAR